MQTSIAVTGIGGYGNLFVRALLSAPPEQEVRFAAAIDPAPERCPHYAELLEACIPIFPDLETFYRSAHADLVVLAAPIHLHAPLTCLALEHGSHVLCEKPLGASVEDARRMLEAEKRSGKVVSIGYQWSFSRAILALKRDLQAGRFGRPLRMKTLVLWPRSRSYFQRNNWAGRVRADDGAWVLDSPANNATAHYLHNMLFVLGGAREASAWPTRVEAELYRANPIENYDTAALRVATDACPDLLFLTAHPVMGYQGPLIHYEFENAVIDFPGEDQAFQATLRGGETITYGSPQDGEIGKLWDTVAAIRGGPPPACGIRAAIPQMACILAAQQTPIHTFPPELVQVQETEVDASTAVEGLFEDLQACYEHNQLPSERGLGWAKGARGVEIDRRIYADL
jgi:predicted dehydrogenase